MSEELVAFYKALADPNRLKIIGFFGDVRVLEIAEAEVARFRAPELVFMNVNTPEELARARTLLPALEPA